MITTNGIVLLKKEVSNWEKKLFETLRAIRVPLLVTEYPIGKDYGVLYEKAERYGVEAIRYDDSIGPTVKHSMKAPLFPERTKDTFSFARCGHFIGYTFKRGGCSPRPPAADVGKFVNGFTTLDHGRLFLCPISAHVGHLNKYFGLRYELTEVDFIDIHKVKDFGEIADFLARPVPFCEYCDTAHRGAYPWARSERVLNEYITE
jgi:hypothetical protein